jgi:hypothetical protein
MGVCPIVFATANYRSNKMSGLRIRGCNQIGRTCTYWFRYVNVMNGEAEKCRLHSRRGEHDPGDGILSRMD